jgi:hypothetical protein
LVWICVSPLSARAAAGITGRWWAPVATTTSAAVMTPALPVEDAVRGELKVIAWRDGLTSPWRAQEAASPLTNEVARAETGGQEPLRARRDIARRILLAWHQTVLLAFSQVGDVMTALDHDSALLEAQRRALDLASTSLRLERINYASGEAVVLSLLDAQRQLQRAALGRAQVQGQLYLDVVQLIVATGGSGWPTPPHERDAGAAASGGR